MKIFNNGIYRDATPQEVADMTRIDPITEIESCKVQLSATDYKVTKCAECSLMGEALPYDIEALHAERQALRDRINELESQIWEA